MHSILTSTIVTTFISSVNNYYEYFFIWIIQARYFLYSAIACLCWLTSVMGEGRRWWPGPEEERLNALELEGLTVIKGQEAIGTDLHLLAAGENAGKLAVIL